MFKIIDYRKISGKSIITIETDDATSALMFRFLAEADKFAELFHYRLTTERRLDASQKTKSEQMAHARKSQANLLKRYREIPGSRTKQMKIIKEMMIGEGVEITLGRLAAKLQLAIKEEKLHNQMLVNRLMRKGNTLKNIGATLSIPRSTAARYARSKNIANRSILTLVETREDRKKHGV